ncbi:MAG: hypothetical protein C0506_10470 [Anaerolinea sp.]|nr:hypothetical protein [Anaerolinea sp.]
MIKGIYSSFTALEAAWRYQDVLANNIANANTAGFKREVASQQSFADVLLSQQMPVPAPLPARIQAVIGQIGTGTFIAEFATDFQEGTLQPTGSELSLATSAGFFQIESEDGTRFYTRDGSFGRDAAGDLVTTQGYYVLDPDGARINLPATGVVVSPDGVISTEDGTVYGTVATYDFQPAQLQRAGEAYFTSATPGQLVSGGVRQGLVERSNTSIVEEMTTLLAVQRTFQANQTVLALLDRTLDQAAGQLGRVGG